MKTTYQNNYGCSPLQQENCAQIFGGIGSVESYIGYAIGYVIGYVYKAVNDVKTVIQIAKQVF
jgi:hypothetical protein